MSTQKMSYFSDIDLATLHRSRLNERIQYKLSWFNRRQKYCIPAVSSKSICQRNKTATQKIKTNANNNHKYNTNAKNTCQSINSIEEMKASQVNSSDLAKITTTPTNRQRKTRHINNNNDKEETSTSINSLLNHWKDSDDSTLEANEIIYLRHNEPEILNRMHEVKQSVGTNLTTDKNGVHRSEKLETLTNSTQSFNRLASSDPSKRHSSSDCRTAKYPSNDALVNRSIILHDRAISNKYNVISLGGAAVEGSSSVDQISAIEEEDLELPHRKRSGTWP